MSQLCGYLEKQNRGGLFASTWVKRWFVVSLDHHLEVYTDSSGQPRDRFPVQSILAVVLCNTNFEFHLKAKHRIYCLRAQSQADCKKWVDGLAAAVAKFKLSQSPELRSVSVTNNQQPLQELKSMEQMPLAPLDANKQNNPRVDQKARPPATAAASPSKPVVMKTATPVKSNGLLNFELKLNCLFSNFLFC
jgi:hypothetical protein